MDVHQAAWALCQQLNNWPILGSRDYGIIRKEYKILRRAEDPVTFPRVRIRVGYRVKPELKPAGLGLGPQPWIRWAGLSTRVLFQPSWYYLVTAEWRVDRFLVPDSV